MLNPDTKLHKNWMTTSVRSCDMNRVGKSVKRATR